MELCNADGSPYADFVTQMALPYAKTKTDVATTSASQTSPQSVLCLQSPFMRMRAINCHTDLASPTVLLFGGSRVVATVILNCQLRLCLFYHLMCSLTLCL